VKSRHKLATRCLACATILLSSILLFAQLGHYALWDDEVGLAIPAKQVWLTGDTSVVDGSNLMAPRGGVILRNLKDRANPPLPAFILAPFAAYAGINTTLLRLPLAISGLLCVGLMLSWLRLGHAPVRVWIILMVGIVGNVSLFLYFRQVRYYGFSILFCTAAVFCYLHWNKSRSYLTVLSLILFGILSTNYMVFAAFMSALIVDYFFWQRHINPLKKRDVFYLSAPLIALGSAVIFIWNPYSTQITHQATMNSCFDRLTLFWWILRDLNANEFGCGLIIISAPFLYASGFKNQWLLRGPVAILTYCFVLAAVSPQPVSLTSVADIRYAAPLIPLCIAIAVVFLWVTTKKLPPYFVALLALVIFGSNLLNNPLLTRNGFHFTIIDYARELIIPPGEPYTPTSQWISRHVANDASIWVLPDYMTYPLMFHAPKAVYAWQLRPEQKDEEQFKNLPNIHFKGLVAPDYIVVFGPSVVQIRKLISEWSMQGMNYQEVARLLTFWKDLYRPELFWRTFKPIENFDPNTEAIYIFKKQP
jgi:hypothetical protein